MAIYAKAVTSTSAGATADTFNNVGTIQLRSDARRVLGFLVCAAPTATTAAEIHHGQVQVTSSDLGVGAQIYPAPSIQGGAIATNDQSVISETEFLPFNWPSRGKENLVVDYSTQLADPTAGDSVVVSAIYEGGTMATASPEALMWFPDMNPLLAKGCDTECAPSVNTAAEEAVTDLNIPAWASEIIGIKVYGINAAVMTAAEEMVGMVRFRSTMPDFEPQEWPMRYSIHPSLGTPVGQPVCPFSAKAYGTQFSTTKKNETVSPYAVLNVASTADIAVSAAVYYR